MESENTKAFSIGGDTNMTLWSGGDQSKAFDFQRVQSPLQETVIDTLGFYRYRSHSLLLPCKDFMPGDKNTQSERNHYLIALFIFQD